MNGLFGTVEQLPTAMINALVGEYEIHESLTELQRAGIDPEELEFMRLDERRAILAYAGLNPDEYDF